MWYWEPAFQELEQNLPGKLGQQSAIYWNSLGLCRDYSLNYIFFRNKTFVFQDRKLKISASVWRRISWNLTKFQLNQTTNTKYGNKNCLNELKFCEVSRNSFLNRCWKFQFSILINKKVLFLNKIWFRPWSLHRPREFQ